MVSELVTELLHGLLKSYDRCCLHRRPAGPLQRRGSLPVVSSNGDSLNAVVAAGDLLRSASDAGVMHALQDLFGKDLFWART